MHFRFRSGGSRAWAGAGGQQAAGSAAAGSGETRGPGWRRAGRMYNAIFELPQRAIFFSPEFPGVRFPLLKSISSAFSLWKCTVRRRRAESAFLADSARRANLPVSGVGAPVEIFDGGDLMKNHDFH